MFVIGSAHPPGEAETYNSLDFRQSEMPYMVKNFVGRPVYIEHDDTHGIGTVVHADQGPGGDLRVVLKIEKDMDKVKESIDKGLLSELSLGVATLNAPHPKFGEVIEQMLPLEVSLVDQGGRKDTRILGYMDGNRFTISNKILSTDHTTDQTMETPTVSISKEDTESMKNLMALQSILDGIKAPPTEVLKIFQLLQTQAQELKMSEQDVMNKYKQEFDTQLAKKQEYDQETQRLIDTDIMEGLIESGIPESEIKGCCDTLLSNKETIAPLVRYTVNANRSSYSNEKHRLEMEQLKTQYENTKKELESTRMELDAEKSAKTVVDKPNWSSNYATAKQNVELNQKKRAAQGELVKPEPPTMSTKELFSKARENAYLN